MNFYFNTVKYKSPSVKVILIKYFIKIIFKYDITLERQINPLLNRFDKTLVYWIKS